MSIAMPSEINQEAPVSIASVSDAPQYFLKDPGTFWFATGQSREFPYRYRGGVITALILGTVTLLLIYFGCLGMVSYLNLQNTGTHTDAVITAHNISSYHDKHGTHYTYSITYRYRVANSTGQTQDYYNTQTVTSSTYYNYNPGSEIGVIYDPLNPQTVIVPGDSARFSFLVALSVAAVIVLLITVPVVLVLIRRTLYDRKLQKDATVLTGNLLTIEGKWYSGKNAHYNITMRYEFTDPKTEQKRSQTALFIRNDLHYTSLPAAGTPVAIAYLDEKHFEML